MGDLNSNLKTKKIGERCGGRNGAKVFFYYYFFNY